MHCFLQVGVLGINHKTASLHVRELLARASEQIAGQKALFFQHATIVLSTCNRTEVYFSAADLAQAHSDLLAFFRAAVKAPFEHCLYSYFGIHCFWHLCRVTAGLDSAILAETAVQRQVKLAYLSAAQNLKLPGCMHYVFQKGFHIAKAVRHARMLNQKAFDFHGTIWHIANEHFREDLFSRSILFIGYSEMNRGLIAYLKQKGMRRLTLSTRYYQDLRLEGCIIGGRDLLNAWQGFDWVICAAQSKEYLLSGKGVDGQLIMDLSVPRNVDPELQRVRLFNIEEIQKMAVERCKSRGMAGHVRQSERLIHEKVHLSARLYRAKRERAESLLVCG